MTPRRIPPVLLGQLMCEAISTNVSKASRRFCSALMLLTSSDPNPMRGSPKRECTMFIGNAVLSCSRDYRCFHHACQTASSCHTLCDPFLWPERNAGVIEMSKGKRTRCYMKIQFITKKEKDQHMYLHVIANCITMESIRTILYEFADKLFVHTKKAS